MGQAAGEGLLMGAVNMEEPAPIWRAAGDAVLSELGCRVVDAYTLDHVGRWEASYACDGATPTTEVIQANRSRWRAGLQVPDPMLSR